MRGRQDARELPLGGRGTARGGWLGQQLPRFAFFGNEGVDQGG